MIRFIRRIPWNIEKLHDRFIGFKDIGPDGKPCRTKIHVSYGRINWDLPLRTPRGN